MTPLTQQDIYLARKRIAPVVRPSPLVPSSRLSALTGSSIYLKLETAQETNAFKVRGAANKLLSLSPAERERGVVAFSTGNHGLAVAHVARTLGVRAVICVSETVPPDRLERLERLGAEVRVQGQAQSEAEQLAWHLAEEQGLTMINPFDDPLVIAGQGTIGLELLEQLPEIEGVLVPLSGGGLLSGIALALKAANPAIRVIGISMERGAFMYHSVRAGRPVTDIEEEETLANSLMGSIGVENRYTLSMVRQYVDEILLLSEEEIAAGMIFAYQQQHLIVEGAGAVGIAALLAGKVREPGRHLALVVSGGNIPFPRLLQIIERYPAAALPIDG